MIATLAWKEYREQRGLWLAIAIVGALVCLNLGLLARGGLAEAHNDQFVRQAILGLLFALMVAQGVVAGVQMFAGESDAGTLLFLDILTSERKLLWHTKLTVSASALLGQALVLFGIAAFLQMDDWTILPWLIVAGWQSLLWGMVGGALCEHVFPAILVGIILAVGNFVVLFMIPIGREVVQITAALLALTLSYRSFCATDVSRRLGAALATRKRRALGGWLTLLWLAERQGRWLVWPGLALSFLGGLLVSANQDYVWPAATLVMGLVCGLAVFASEQAGEHDRFLGGQRLPPGRIWLVKTFFWALAAASMAAPLYLGMNYRYRLTFGSPHSGMYWRMFQATFFPDGNSGLFFMEWVLYGFACGHFCGFLSRRLVVAGFLAAGFSLIFLGLWLSALLFGGAMDWQVLPVPFLLLIAARLCMWPWFSGRLYTRRHALLLAACGAALLLWFGANLWYRAVQIPDVGEPFDVRAFDATLDRAAHSEANPLMRRGLELLANQRNLVADKLGRATKRLFPRASNENGDPEYLISGDFLSACEQIVTQGWPAQDDELNRWLDAIFAGEWAKNFQDAAGKPLGLVIDPRKFNWFASQENYAIYSDLTVRLTGYADVGNLLAVRAMQLQKRGDDDGTMDNLRSLLGLSCQVRNCFPRNTGLYEYPRSVSRAALRCFDYWAERVGPKPRLIKEALAIWQRYEKELPDPLDGLKADYVIDHDNLARLWAVRGNPSPQPLLVKWALETPWEGERQARFINAIYQGQIRAAELWPSKVASGGGGQIREAFRLTNSSWTPAQWEQLVRSVSMYFRWPWLSATYDDTYVDTRIREVWLALMLYQSEEGKAPAKLEDLVPRYLPSLPVDPQTKRPFGYKVSHGDEVIAGHFYRLGEYQENVHLLPGQGVLFQEGTMVWFPVPMWSKK